MSAGAPPPGPREDPPTLSQPDVPPPGGPRPPGVPPPGDRALWPWLLLLLVLVVGGVIAAIVFLGGNDDDKSSGTGPLNTKTGTVLVPAVIGMRRPQATARLEQLGLNVGTREQPSRRAAGVVLSQTPKAGTRLPRGALVGLAVSSGPPQAGVPNVVGLTAAQAAARLLSAGLHARTTEVAAQKPAGTVVAQSPAAGAKLAHGSTVSLRVSKGPPKVQVPDVVGLARAAAARKVRAAGLVAKPVVVPSLKPAGTVVAQFPRAASTVARASSVRLNVSQGPTGGAAASRVEVPNVVGRRQAAAQRTLFDAGLRSETGYAPSRQPPGTVLSQTPRAGTTVARRTRVALEVSLGPGGPQPTAVPDVVGEDQATATSDLQNAGFQVQVLRRATSDPKQDGLVLDEDPAAGSQAPPGATVTIVVGR